jgi:quercetin dioxygenase-like cupin family protein
MTTALSPKTGLFTVGSEPAFPLPDSPTVAVSPLLRSDDGHQVDVFFLTIPEGSSVPREVHPFSETLVPVSGALACSVGDAEPMIIGPGHVIHIPADVPHAIESVGDVTAVATMIIGV